MCVVYMSYRLTGSDESEYATEASEVSFMNLACLYSVIYFTIEYRAFQSCISMCLAPATDGGLRMNLPC